MPARRPTKADQRRVIAIDLQGDWHAFADPLPPATGPHDWRYFGTIVIDGQRGALAWRAGGFGVGTGASVRELGLWDHIKIQRLLETRPPGIEGAPKFEAVVMASTGMYMGRR